MLFGNMHKIAGCPVWVHKDSLSQFEDAIKTAYAGLTCPISFQIHTTDIIERGFVFIYIDGIDELPAVFELPEKDE